MKGFLIGSIFLLLLYSLMLYTTYNKSPFMMDNSFHSFCVNKCGLTKGDDFSDKYRQCLGYCNSVNQQE
jgi:hypothetical protein